MADAVKVKRGRVVNAGSGDVLIVVRVDGHGNRPLPGHLPPTASVRLVSASTGTDAGRRSLGGRRPAVRPPGRCLELPRGRRRYRPLRVLVGLRACVDREALHDVVGCRYLRRSAGCHLAGLCSYLCRCVGQLTDARYR